LASLEAAAYSEGVQTVMQPLSLIDTELDFYLKDGDQFVCLNCTLPLCQPNSDECPYRQTQGYTREKNRDYQMRSRDRKKVKAPEDRKEYFQDRYYGKKLIGSANTDTTGDTAMRFLKCFLFAIGYVAIWRTIKPKQWL
jgi:hypothetical protein